MGYRLLIKNQVKNAFNLIGDLATDVTLVSKEASNFNFNTQTVTLSAGVTKVVKGVVINTFEDQLKQQPVTKLLMKAEDITEPDLYDKATIAGVTWNIVPPYENNGYTISVTISRGV